MIDDRQKMREQISAYVDGELTVEERAAVNARAAEDPAFARELAAISRLKATVSETVPPVDPAIEPPRPVRRKRSALAALAASLVIAAGGGWYIHDRQQGPDVSLAPQWSIAIHRAWAPTAGANAGGVTVEKVSSALNPHIPDLTATGLDIAFVGAEPVAHGNGSALVVGYMGSRGCRLTLIIRRMDGKPDRKPLDIGTGAVQGYRWDAGSLRYTLLAEGMASARFELIAKSVRRASFDHLPLDQQTRMALSRNRAESRPCRA